MVQTLSQLQVSFGESLENYYYRLEAYTYRSTTDFGGLHLGPREVILP